VRFPVRGSARCPDDVVVLAAVKLDQAKRRAVPANAVGAFGQAGDLARGFAAAAIYHPKLAAIAENCHISAFRPFPGGVELKTNLAGDWTVEFQPRAVQASDQAFIHEQLGRGSNPQRRAGKRVESGNGRCIYGRLARLQISGVFVVPPAIPGGGLARIFPPRGDGRIA